MIPEQSNQTAGGVGLPVVALPPPAEGLDSAHVSLDDRLLQFEASWISWALKISRGNKSKAARLLRVKRSTLGDRIKRCGLDVRS
jgi:DNA-binding NtrC family response regulator